MPIPRHILDENLGRVNAERPRDLPVTLEEFTEQRFRLSFPERALPEGQCIDQDFSAIQWALHEHGDISTNLVGARLDEETQRYHVEYEVVEWD